MSYPSEGVHRTEEASVDKSNRRTREDSEERRDSFDLLRIDCVAICKRDFGRFQVSVQRRMSLSELLANSGTRTRHWVEGYSIPSLSLALCRKTRAQGSEVGICHEWVEYERR